MLTRPDRGSLSGGTFVAVVELLVDVLVHEGGLADAAVPEDDDLQEHLLPAAGRHRVGERRGLGGEGEGGLALRWGGQRGGGG